MKKDSMNQSTFANTSRWGAVILLVAAGAFLGSNLVAADISQDEAKKLQNPIPYSDKSVKAGQAVFMGNCTGCHGENGKAEAAIVGSATDLTAPALYKSGTTPGEIFRSIRQGAGIEMPAFQYQGVSEEDAWNLVNFIHSLWPADKRPK